MPVSLARLRAVGASVRIQATVVGEPGHVGADPLAVVADGASGIFVRLPSALRPGRGALVDLEGRIAAPYGQVELRVVTASVGTIGRGSLPDPTPIAAAALGESTEGRLVVLEGELLVPPERESDGGLLIRLRDAAGTEFRARSTAAAAISPSLVRKGDRLRVTGIVGQRATRAGTLDGYRLWLRDAADVTRLAAAPTPTPRASPSPARSPVPHATPTSRATPSHTPRGARTSIAAALRAGGSAAVEGVVTTPATLLDASGRRIVIQDQTAAVEVLLPKDTAAPPPGARVAVAGEVGTAYGAPRLAAGSIERLPGTGGAPAAVIVRNAPGAALEWRLVRAEGVVTSRQRIGDRWRAEIDTGAATVVIAGLAGAAIPADTVARGTRLTVTGIARRPAPSATDQQFAIVPRSPADLHVTGHPGTVGTSAGATARPASGGGSGGVASDPVTGSTDGATGTPATATPMDLGDLAAVSSRQRPGGGTLLVSVGGLVTGVDAAGITLDDGTGSGRLVLEGEAAAFVPLLSTGDAIGATGTLEVGPDGAEIRVADASAVARLGDLGEALPVAEPGEVDAGDLPGDPAATLDAMPGGSAAGFGSAAAQAAIAGAASRLPAQPAGTPALAWLLVLGAPIVAGGGAIAARTSRRNAARRRPPPGPAGASRVGSSGDPAVEGAVELGSPHGIA